MKLLSHAVLMFAMALAAAPAAFGQTAHAGTDKTMSAGPQEGGVTAEILRLEREYDRAYTSHSLEAAERLHTEDFRMTARGKVVTKAELLARLRDAGSPRDVIESLTTDDVQVRHYGESVVTTGRWKRVSKDAAGHDTSAEGFFTRVWVKRDGRWLMAVAHYSPLAAPAK